MISIRLEAAVRIRRETRTARTSTIGARDVNERVQVTMMPRKKQTQRTYVISVRGIVIRRYYSHGHDDDDDDDEEEEG